MELVVGNRGQEISRLWYKVLRLSIRHFHELARSLTSQINVSNPTKVSTTSNVHIVKVKGRSNVGAGVLFQSLASYHPVLSVEKCEWLYFNHNT